jgi:hypothetical protein
VPFKKATTPDVTHKLTRSRENEKAGQTLEVQVDVGAPQKTTRSERNLF